MIDVEIYTPQGLYKKTEASIINVVSEEGQRGILPNHMPMVVSLAIGPMNMEEKKREYYAIHGGVLYFSDNKATILTPAIENRDEIDIERAQSAKERAEKHISDPNMDIKRAQLALQRALARIKVKND